MAVVGGVGGGACCCPFKLILINADKLTAKLINVRVVYMCHDKQRDRDRDRIRARERERERDDKQSLN